MRRTSLSLTPTLRVNPNPIQNNPNLCASEDCAIYTKVYLKKAIAYSLIYIYTQFSLYIKLYKYYKIAQRRLHLFEEGKLEDSEV